MASADVVGVVAAEAAASPDLLTVLEFGDGHLARLLLADEATSSRLEEVVVVGSSATRSAAAAPAAGTHVWKTSCKTPRELLTLRRALLRAGRARIAIVATTSGQSATRQLRVLQLFAALPCATLLLLAASPPSSSDRSHQKAVFCASDRCRLTLGMLPRAEPGRLLAWRDFLAGSLAGGAVSVDGHLIVSRKEPAPPPQQQQQQQQGAAEEEERGDEEEARRRLEQAALFPPVSLSVVEQLSDLRREVEASVDLLPPAVLRPRGAAAREERLARLVPSSAARYVEAGYASLHYVPQPPSPHASCFELRLEPRSVPPLDAARASGDGEQGAEGGEAVGYIALQAYGVSEPARQFPAAVAWRTLHAAQVERLVVRPAWRGCGAKEALLAACAPYASRGYSVRVRTGSERVHHSFMRCDLLAYEGHRPPGTTTCGVRRPMKRYARVLDNANAAAAAPSSAPDSCPSAAASRSAEARVEPPSVPVDAGRASDLRWRPAAPSGGDDDSGGGGGGGDDGGGESDVARRRSALPSAPSASARGLINKLTSDNFEKLLPQLRESALSGLDALRACLRLFFQRAAREPLFCSLYTSAVARLTASGPPAEAPPLQPAGAPPLQPVGAPPLEPDDMRAAVEAELRAVLDSCGASEHDKGTGRLAAELVRRRLVDPARLLDLLLGGSAGRLCAFAACAGTELRRRSPGVLARVVEAVGTAAASADAPLAACAFVLECDRRGWPADEEEAAAAAAAAVSVGGLTPAGPLQTVAAVRAAAADELGLILVPRNAPAETLRGLREGWVHWYVGTPTVHPESGERFNFDEAAGRIVAVEPP